MPNLGGLSLRGYIMYCCPHCEWGSIDQGHWYLTGAAASTAMVGDECLVTYVSAQQWRHPNCVAKFRNCEGSRMLVFDTRRNQESEGDVEVFALPMSQGEGVGADREPLTQEV